MPAMTHLGVRLLIFGAVLVGATACGQRVTGQAVAGDHTPIASTSSAPPSSRSTDDPPPAGGSSTSSTTRPPSGSGGLAGIEGTWEGQYTCGQGNTGLKLTIKAAEGRTLPAVFAFYPLEDNPSAARGSYTMVGSLNSAGHLVFKQQAWIDQPPTYHMVDLQVTSPLDEDTDTLSGDVLDSGCKGFSVRRR